MSCFVVSYTHINALIDIEDQYRSPYVIRPSNKYDDTAWGRELLKANQLAYAERYRETEEVIEDENYHYVDTGHKFTDAEALTIVKSFLYQLSEFEPSDMRPNANYVKAIETYANRLKHAIIDKALPTVQPLWGVKDRYAFVELAKNRAVQ